MTTGKSVRRVPKWFLWVLLGTLAMGGSFFLVRLAIDEVSLSSSLRALASQDPAVRENAAAAIRDIVSRYPSGTVNILTLDGGAARWKRKLANLRPGQTENDVVRILAPQKSPTPLGLARVDPFLRGRSATQNYQLDDHWACAVEYAILPGSTQPVVVRVGALQVSESHIVVAPSAGRGFSGVWTQYYSNGEKYDDTPIANDNIAGKTIRYSVGSKNAE